jgi:hypothetical protein
MHKLLICLNRLRRDQPSLAANIREHCGGRVLMVKLGVRSISPAKPHSVSSSRMRKGQTLRVTATRVFRNVLRVFWNARAKYCTRHHSSRTCGQALQLMVQVSLFLCSVYSCAHNDRQQSADASL